MQNHIPPTYKKTAFHCPNCGAYSNIIWTQIYYPTSGFSLIKGIDFALCVHCNIFSHWAGGKMIYPISGNAALPNNDLPKDIIDDYLEARNVFNISPRGAAALLRLAIQKLCIYLGESGKNINDDIASLVKKGLPIQIQQALDIVRVIGNQAVHPGQIDLKDDIETVNKLFSLVNIIAQQMITQPNEIKKMFESLPENHLKGIERRDKSK